VVWYIAVDVELVILTCGRTPPCTGGHFKSPSPQRLGLIEMLREILPGLPFANVSFGTPHEQCRDTDIGVGHQEPGGQLRLKSFPEQLLLGLCTRATPNASTTLALP
jgi:hypothetical protein